MERVLDDGPDLRRASLEPCVQRLGRALGHGLDLAALDGDAPIDVLAQAARVLRGLDLFSLGQPV